MKNIIAAVLFVWCCNALSGDLPDLGEPSPGRYELTKGQIAGETVFVALMYTDYRQTMDIGRYCARERPTANIKQPDGRLIGPNGESCYVRESNPLLGEHPSEVRIRNYFLGMTLAHVAIAKTLPTEYRPYWIGSGILVQLAQVIKNKRVGVSANF